MEVTKEEFTTFLDALLAYFKATGTLEPLAAKHEDNRALNIA
ncbi:hypothetical protein [Klebsiella aerogenes]|nr:hypothetical protein [Klebsiella aerogenes]